MAVAVGGGTGVASPGVGEAACPSGGVGESASNGVGSTSSAPVALSPVTAGEAPVQPAALTSKHTASHARQRVTGQPPGTPKGLGRHAETR